MAAAFFFRFVVFRTNLFFMKNFLALYTSIMNTVFFSFRFSDFVIGLPPASVKEEGDLSESRIILRNMFFFNWIANGKSH